MMSRTRLYVEPTEALMSQLRKNKLALEKKPLEPSTLWCHYFVGTYTIKKRKMVSMVT